MLALLRFSVVHLVLFAGRPLDVCHVLVSLLIWLLLVLVLCRRLLLKVMVMGFTGLVVLDLGGKEFD